MKRFLIFVIAVSMLWTALSSWAIPMLRFRPVSGQDGPVARRTVKHVSLRPQPALRASESMDVPAQPNRLQEWRLLSRNLIGPRPYGCCTITVGRDLKNVMEFQNRLELKP